MNVPWQEVKAKFQQVWGYADFRAPQGEIVRTLITGRDALIVLPTGRGKSICFQLPALLQTGLTLVVSPLVALMENQVNQLERLGLDAALLHSELSRRERTQTLKAIATQKLSLLYLSPETLFSLPLWNIIAQPELKITGLIIDEVHCLTHWGTTFRPAYRRLGAVRRSLLQHKPPGTKIAIAAFTATANPQVQRDICQTLELERPARFSVSPARANLSLNVKTVWTPKGRKQQMLRFIEAHPRSGLVYVRSRQDSQTIADSCVSLGYKAAAYHAGIASKQRRNIESDWIDNRLQFVVCTSAFGMGIDKPDVRWVVHYHAPELIAEYVQEVGRAGRDNCPATALTLVGEPTGWLDPEDKQRSQFFARQQQQQYHQALRLASKLPERGAISEVKGFPQAELALSILHSMGRVSWTDPFHYRMSSGGGTSESLANRSKTVPKRNAAIS